MIRNEALEVDDSFSKEVFSKHLSLAVLELQYDRSRVANEARMDLQDLPELEDELRKFIAVASAATERGSISNMPSKEVDALWHALLDGGSINGVSGTEFLATYIPHIECLSDQERMESTLELVEASFGPSDRRYWVSAAGCGGGGPPGGS